MAIQHIITAGFTRIIIVVLLFGIEEEGDLIVVVILFCQLQAITVSTVVSSNHTILLLDPADKIG